MGDGKWNPRYVLWTRAIGKAPEDLQRGEDGEIARVRDPESGKLLPWTYVYSKWVRERWREWALELGYKDRDGWLAHESAIANGADRGETAFDPWLERWVERLRAERLREILSEQLHDAYLNDVVVHAVAERAVQFAWTREQMLTEMVLRLVAEKAGRLTELDLRF